MTALALDIKSSNAKRSWKYLSGFRELKALSLRVFVEEYRLGSLNLPKLKILELVGLERMDVFFQDLQHHHELEVVVSQGPHKAFEGVIRVLRSL